MSHIRLDSLDLDSLLGSISQLVVSCPTGCHRPRGSTAAKRDADSTIVSDKTKFPVHVQQFKPDEITVNVTGKNTITVEGRHEEKKNEHSSTSKHFVRRYVLLERQDANGVVSNSPWDGVLNTTAPRVYRQCWKRRSTVPLQFNRLDNSLSCKGILNEKKQ